MSEGELELDEKAKEMIKEFTTKRTDPTFTKKQKTWELLNADESILMVEREEEEEEEEKVLCIFPGLPCTKSSLNLLSLKKEEEERRRR